MRARSEKKYRRRAIVSAYRGSSLYWTFYLECGHKKMSDLYTRYVSTGLPKKTLCYECPR